MPGPMSKTNELNQLERHWNCPETYHKGHRPGDWCTRECGTNCTGQKCNAYTGKTQAKPRIAANTTRIHPIVTERLPGYKPKKRTRR